jgi:dihydrofolate reductase
VPRHSTEFVSLDGVMQAPGGGEGFKYEAWSFAFDRGAEGDQFKLDEDLDSQALLLGRVTYESFAKAWPSRQGQFADKFNTMSKYLVSSTVRDPQWNNTTALGGRLFGPTSDQETLRLVESTTVGEGIAILIYQPTRNHAHASSE